uniref:(northern house mosquito) hypothetical protein n=1 Tax=Culex pipiens TaxID=7175 RepID=A0A8D8HNN9_CULPI
MLPRGLGICTTVAVGGRPHRRSGTRRRRCGWRGRCFLGYHSVRALTVVQQVQLLDRAAAGRRLPVVDRANAADYRGRNLGFGVTFCSYDCAGMLLRLWLEMSLLIAGWPPADIRLLLKLRNS